MKVGTFCPITATAAILGQKWTLMIVYHLLSGTRRFCELQDLLGGVNPTTLSQRLKALESEGLVTRRVVQSIPPWTEYSLTEKGTAMQPILRSLAEWGTVWLQQPEAQTEEQERVAA